MCGISGIISKDENDYSTSLRAMNAVIAHRGPDNDGYYIENKIHLAHQRLSIIDLSDAAHQPYLFENYVVIFNGEIYNYIEIRNELKKLGHIFQTESDTEVLLKAYIQFGNNCVQKFNGMWAFVIYNKISNEIFCSRDRFGIKPFYYTNNKNYFAIASEIKQLVETFDLRNLNLKTLINFIAIGFEDTNSETFFEEVYSLPGGHNLIYNIANATFEIESYYTLQTKNELNNVSLQEASNILDDTLQSSINYRLRADVSVATCLSGGLDSSIIASIASKQYYAKSKNKFLAFTASSTDNSNNEVKYAKNIVDKHPIDWHIVEPQLNDFTNDLDKVIYQLDEPFSSPSVFMQHYVMKAIHQQNCKVVLDGQGGDETFLGYERYFPLNKNSMFSLSFWKYAFQASQNSRLSFKQFILYNAYFTNYKIRKYGLQKKHGYIKQKFYELNNYELLRQSTQSYKDPASLQILELTKTQLPHLLKYEDRNSMYYAIETRLPFLDYRMVELAISLPIELKLKNGWTKFLLRSQYQNILGENIAWRKNKFGFEAPNMQWLAYNKVIDDTILQSEILRHFTNYIPNITNDWHLKWKLFNIARWAELYKVKY